MFEVVKTENHTFIEDEEHGEIWWKRVDSAAFGDPIIYFVSLKTQRKAKWLLNRKLKKALLCYHRARLEAKQREWQAAQLASAITEYAGYEKR